MELGRILKIEQNITKANLKVIKAFHKFVFENDDGRNNRRNLRKFKGFDFKDDNDERSQAKINFAMNNLTLGELNSICQILCVDNDANDKKELVEMLCGKLSGLELKNLDDDIHDDGSRKDDDATHIDEKEGKSDDESELEMADISKSNNMSDGEQSFTKNFENNSKTFHPKFMLTFKDIEETLRTFDGAESHSINKWIVEFEETSLMMGWNEVEKLIYGKRLMKGEALLFIRAEKGITSWTALKTKLTKEFGRTTNSAVIHKRLTTRKKKKDETLWQYLMKMREIAAEGDIEEEALIEYVTEGIVDDEINKTILYGPTTLKEFKEKLKMYERLKEKQGREHRDTKKEDFMRQNNTKQTQRKQDTIKERDERNMRCFNCGKGGHQAKNCRDKDKGLKCFKCDNFGHIAKECEREKPQRKNFNRDETKELYVAQETKMELSRYKTVILNGREINGFIDTGSDLNLIKVTAFLQIGGPKFDETPITIKGIGDNCITTLGKFKTEMKMDDCIFATDIHIVPEEAIPMKFIIGKPVLEFATLTINNKGIKVTENGEKRDFINTRETEKEREELSDIFMIQMDNNTLNVGKLGCYKRISNIVQAYKPQHRQSTAIRTKIILSDEIPVYQSPRRLSFMEKKEVERQIEEWIADGIVRPSISDYASPIVLVKKRDGSTRICIDYRKLNRKIIKDRYPLPVIEDQINRLAKAKIFTTLDLKNGFFHVPVDEDSVKYTSFVTPSGQYEFLRTPFGLCNSPAIFQRYVNEVFKKLIHKGIVLTYMDDLIIPSTTVEEAYSNLEEVLRTAENYGLEFKWSKCYFMDTKVEYLGHEIEDGTVKPSLRKIKAVMNFPIPTTIKKVQSFLGLTGYFRKYIKDYALIAKPLSDMLKDEKKFKFEEDESASFKKLKELLCTEPVLKIFDHESETELHVDASSDGFGAVLLQKNMDDGQLHPVYYWSRKTNDAQKKYHSYELEVLAVVEALKKFRVYLLGIQFKILTDCASFAVTMNKKDLCTRIARWALLLEEYNYTLEHRPGIRMKHCDALSRNPILMIITKNEFLERLLQAQKNDSHLRAIFKILENRPYENFVIHKNLLYKEVENENLLVIPEGMQYDIIRKAHENGHFATKKTKELIDREYYIPELEKKIQRVISNCISCILTERKSGKQEGLLNPINKGDTPLDTYHIDHLGPMEKTGKAYKYLLVVVDSFTKFVWLYPTKSTTTKEVLEKLEQQKQIFGNPRVIVSDRGTAFTSNDFEAYCQNEEIRHIKITTGEPRGNGQVERINRIIIPALSKMTIEKPEHWYKYVRKLQETLNNSYQRSINMTPFELLFGTKMRRPEDIRMREVIEEEYANLFIESRNELRREAKEQIKKIQEENRKTFNKRRKRSQQYQVNDLVAIKRTQFQNDSKLLPKFYGPYQVVSIYGPDRYNLEKVGNHNGPNKTTSSAEKMKPWMPFEANDS